MQRSAMHGPRNDCFAEHSLRNADLEHFECTTRVREKSGKKNGKYLVRKKESESSRNCRASCRHSTILNTFGYVDDSLFLLSINKELSTAMPDSRKIANIGAQYSEQKSLDECK
ncbi:unnamed protein product [Clavelina lepadiformis]|uniref:Uncharacterized protein n=1 Tax=Clavelina lepadiformis TaxID=159417 RepID=A0ABP0FAZ4_CLALP